MNIPEKDKPPKYCCHCGRVISRGSSICNACHGISRLTAAAKTESLDMVTHNRDLQAKAAAYASIKYANRYNRFKNT